jgi:hypothetical protein
MQSSTDSTLQNPLMSEILTVAQPLVQWMIKSGIGYNEFAQALKPLFLSIAEKELQRLNQKTSDSAISLLSGLHRKDVRAYREESIEHSKSIENNLAKWSKPSIVNQVFTRWISSEAPKKLPFHSKENDQDSFESLSQSVSKDVHPRALLQEMIRLGLVNEHEGVVHLMKNSFIPDAHQRHASELLSASVADHLTAGVHNMDQTQSTKYLEQSVFANELSKESIDQLRVLAKNLWEGVLKDVVQVASLLCEKDVGCPDPHRFRLGFFAFDAPEITTPSSGE